VYYGWFLAGSFIGRVRRLAVVVFAVAVGLLVAIPTMGMEGFADSYTERMSRVSGGDTSTRSREVAIEAELSDWMDGNVLVGRGLGYYFAPEIGAQRGGGEVAYAHIGYVTYLSQLGVIGLAVFGFWFPLSSIALARRVRANAQLGPWSRHLASLSAAVFIFSVFVHAMSGSFLTPDVLIGVLGGVVSSLSSKRIERRATTRATS
jgi:O-antigen ligase